jgi:hypothetical protein
MTTTAITTIARTEGEQVLGECRRLIQLLWREVESATSESGQRSAMKRYMQALNVYEQAVKLYPEAWGR